MKRGHIGLSYWTTDPYAVYAENASSFCMIKNLSLSITKDDLKEVLSAKNALSDNFENLWIYKTENQGISVAVVKARNKESMQMFLNNRKNLSEKLVSLAYTNYKSGPNVGIFLGKTCFS